MQTTSLKESLDLQGDSQLQSKRLFSIVKTVILPNFIYTEKQNCHVSLSNLDKTIIFLILIF